MNQLASASQLRMSLLRWALFVVPVVMFLGYLSGTISGSTAENSWYQTLIKPEAQPPGWVFSVVWPTLYFLMGLAFAMILHARGAKDRNIAIVLFVSQFLINLTWSPVFFGLRRLDAAFGVMIGLWISVVATTAIFFVVDPFAGWLMAPYVVWVSYAGALTLSLWQRTGGAPRGTVAPA